MCVTENLRGLYVSQNLFKKKIKLTLLANRLLDTSWIFFLSFNMYKILYALMFSRQKLYYKKKKKSKSMDASNREKRSHPSIIICHKETSHIYKDGGVAGFTSNHIPMHLSIFFSSYALLFFTSMRPTNYSTYFF